MTSGPSIRSHDSKLKSRNFSTSNCSDLKKARADEKQSIFPLLTNHNSSESKSKPTKPTTNIMSSDAKTTYYISITGLQVNSLWNLPKFVIYSQNAKKQALAAAGNMGVKLHGPINGVYHTMTVWKDRKSMTRFMASGAHAKAMKITQEIYVPGGTKVYGYETETIPTWDEAYQLWTEKGTLHGRKPAKNVAVEKPSSGVSTATLLVTGLGVMALAVGYLQRYHSELFEGQMESTI